MKLEMINWSDYPNFKKEEFDCRETKENEKLKDENEKLKKYDSIENGEHSANDAYNARLWK